MMNIITSQPLSLVVIINILQKVFSYSIFFILAYILSHNEYGLFETIYSIGYFGVMVFGLQAESAFARYYYIDKENNQLSKSIFNVILIYLFGSILFFSLFQLFNPRFFQFDNSNLSIYLLLFVIINLIYSLVLIYFRFEAIYKIYIAAIIYEIITFFSLLGFFYLKNLLSIEYLLILFSMPKLSILFYILFTKASKDAFQISIPTITKYLKYSINIIPVVAISFGVLMFSRIFVLNNFNDLTLSNYSMGLRISMAYLFFNEVFRFIVDPVMIKKDRTENVESLMENVFIKYTELLLYFNIFMIISFYFLNIYFLSYRFEDLAMFMPYLFLANFFNLLINYFLLVHNLNFKTIYNFIAFFIGAIIFSLSLYLSVLSVTSLLFSLLLFYFSTFIIVFFLSKKNSTIKLNFKYVYISLFIMLINLFIESGFLIK